MADRKVLRPNVGIHLMLRGEIRGNTKHVHCIGSGGDFDNLIDKHFIGRFLSCTILTINLLSNKIIAQAMHVLLGH